MTTDHGEALEAPGLCRCWAPIHDGPCVKTCHGCGRPVDRSDVCMECVQVFEHDHDTWDDSSPEAGALRLKISRARDAIRIAAGKRPKFT